MLSEGNWVVIKILADELVLRLALAVLKDLLASLIIARATSSSDIFFNVDFSLHPALGRRQVLENLVVTIVFSDSESLLDDVLFIIKRYVQLQRSLLSVLLGSAPFRTEALVNGKEWPLLDNLRCIC